MWPPWQHLFLNLGAVSCVQDDSFDPSDKGTVFESLWADIPVPDQDVKDMDGAQGYPELSEQ